MKSSVVLFGIAVAWLVTLVYNKLNINYTKHNFGLNECQVANIPNAAEDLELYNDLVISGTSDLRNLFFGEGSATQRGGLIQFDPVRNIWSEIPIENFPQDLDFNPHGINLFHNQLYVINHAYKNHSEQVEVFVLNQVDGAVKATYEKSIVIGEEFLGRLNDLAVVSDGEFYITEWTTANHLSYLTRVTQFLLGMFLKRTRLFYCKDLKGFAECQVVDRGHMMNGVITFEDQLFVADSLSMSVYSYTILEDKNLTNKQVVKLNHLVDNLSFYSPRKIYSAGIVKPLEAISGTSGVVTGAVSEIVKEGHTWKAKQIVEEDLISMPSTAIRFGDSIVMSSPIDYKLVTCSPAPYNL